MYHTHSQGSVEISATLKNGKDLLIQQCLDQSFNKNFHGLLSSKLTFLLGASLGSWTLFHVPYTARERAGRESPLPGVRHAGSEEKPLSPRKINSPQISASVPRFLLLPQEAPGR